MPKKLQEIPSRVCVLVGRQEWVAPPPGTECTSRQHGHMTYALALIKLKAEMAEQVTQRVSVWRKDKWVEIEQDVPAVRLRAKRTWRGVLSGVGEVRVKVMQLVP